MSKVRVFFKDPDALGKSIVDKDAEEVYEILSEYVEYGEYVTLEVDTETKTVRLVKVKE